MKSEPQVTEGSAIPFWNRGWQCMPKWLETVKRTAMQGMRIQKRPASPCGPPRQARKDRARYTKLPPQLEPEPAAQL